MRNIANTPTPVDILEIISDPISMDIITAISNEVTNSVNRMQILDMIHKKFYSRYSRLVSTGVYPSKQEQNRPFIIWAGSPRGAIENRKCIFTLTRIEEH